MIRDLIPPRSESGETLRKCSHVILASRSPRKETMSIKVYVGSIDCKKRNCKLTRERKILTLPTRNRTKKDKAT